MRWKIGSAEIVRILDLELPLGPDLLVIGDSAEQQAATIERAAWAVPQWATADNKVVFAFAAIGIRSEGRRIVVDPALGFDDRRAFPDAADQEASFDRATRQAGFAPEDVDVVVNTHDEGIGWNARLDGTAFFPNARYVWPKVDVAQRGAPVAFDTDAIDPPHALTGEVTIESARGHTEGSPIVRVRSGGDEAVVVGDLFIHPLQLADVEWSGNDMLAAETIELRRSLLGDAATRGVLIVSQHFPTPGGGHVRAEAGAWALA